MTKCTRHNDDRIWTTFNSLEETLQSLAIYQRDSDAVLTHETIDLALAITGLFMARAIQRSLSSAINGPAKHQPQYGHEYYTHPKPGRVSLLTHCQRGSPLASPHPCGSVTMRICPSERIHSLASLPLLKAFQCRHSPRLPLLIAYIPNDITDEVVPKKVASGELEIRTNSVDTCPRLYTARVRYRPSTNPCSRQVSGSEHLEPHHRSSRIQTQTEGPAPHQVVRYQMPRTSPPEPSRRHPDKLRNQPDNGQHRSCLEERTSRTPNSMSCRHAAGEQPG